MKFSLILTLLSSALLCSAFAGEQKLPKSAPIATVTFPDKWKVEAEEDNLEASSPDDEIYFYMEIIDGNSVESAVKEGLAYLEKEKVAVNGDSMKKKEGTINDVPFVGLSFEAKDKDGPCKVSLMFFVMTKEKALSVIYWGGTEGEKAHEAELSDIAKSVKRAAK